MEDFVNFAPGLSVLTNLFEGTGNSDRPCLEWPQRSLIYTLKGDFMTVTNYPDSPVEIVKDNYFGQDIEDPYRWLEEQQSQATREWVRKQHEHTLNYVRKTDRREETIARLKSLLEVESYGLPTFRQGMEFFSKIKPGESQHILYHKPPGETEQVLVDPHFWDPENHLYSVVLCDVSRDARLLAYRKYEGGDDEHEIHVIAADHPQEPIYILPKRRYTSCHFDYNANALIVGIHSSEGPKIVHVELESPGKEAVLFGEGYDEEIIIVSQQSHSGQYFLSLVVKLNLNQGSSVYFNSLSFILVTFGIIGSLQLIHLNNIAPSE